MMEIDGSYLEGGGQIIRTSIGLSCVKKEPVHIFNIRANRKPPGLKTQHLAAINSVKELCGGRLEGGGIGSREIWFYPGKIEKDKLDIKIFTAGSVALVLQTIFLASLGIERELKVRIEGGGTFGKWAPSVEYLKNVFLPTVEKFGFKAEIEILKHGFYPKGGAKVVARIFPSRLKGYEIEKEVKGIRGVSIATKNLEKGKVGERQKESAEKLLEDFSVKLEAKYVEALSTGTGIEIWSEPTRIGGNCLGERGLRAEKVGERAAENLLEELDSGVSVDKHLADQLIPFMGLVGESSYLVRELTNHIKTNIWVTEKFIERRFNLEKKENLFRVSI